MLVSPLISTAETERRIGSSGRQKTGNQLLASTLFDFAGIMWTAAGAIDRRQFTQLDDVGIRRQQRFPDRQGCAQELCRLREAAASTRYLGQAREDAGAVALGPLGLIQGGKRPTV